MLENYLTLKTTVKKSYHPYYSIPSIDEWWWICCLVCGKSILSIIIKDQAIKSNLEGL